MSCKVCTEDYSPGERAPLVLPCGHTFCRTCLATLKHRQAANFRCPTCQKPQRDLQVDQLQVVFDLLNVSPSPTTDTKHDLCTNHEEDLKYWCCECSVALCGLCLNTGSHLGHKVLATQKFVQNEKSQLCDQVQAIKTNIKKQQEAVKGKLSKVYRSSCRDLYQLQEIDSGVTKLLTEVKQASSVAELLKYKSQVEDFHNQTQQTPHTLSGDTTIDGTAKSDEESLLLTSILFQADSRLSIQVPSEVFLELSVGSRCLGRVNIRLWGHLRRARQMLALCVGSLGPSYTGASAVKHEDACGEYVWFPYYMSDNNINERKGLISGLEYDGEHRRSAKEGLVTACDDGRGEAMFYIITRVRKDCDAFCPFGEVTSGMEVLRAATYYLPDKKVTITNSGVVLFDLGDLSQ